MSDLKIALQLLDASQTHPLQVWEFEDLEEVRVGRSVDNDLQIGHPYVSRSHAILQFQDGQWMLRVSSQQGVVIRGKKYFEYWLENQLVFQLGPGGPHLRFVSAEQEDESDNIRDTMAFDLDTTPFLQLDQNQRDEEVKEIVEEPYFQNLQRIADQLRKQRQVGNGSDTSKITND